jgi:hypothetical protein
MDANATAQFHHGGNFAHKMHTDDEYVLKKWQFFPLNKLPLTL